MSGELHYNFAGIEGGAGQISAAVQSTHGLLDDGQASLQKLAAAWGGSGSEAYQDVQRRWDQASLELNQALDNLRLKIGEAGQAMAHTEAGVTNMFA
ncbi:hypothetical protein A5641_19345 [Mycobacterium sp. 1554424.7]|nr:hypothetical protein A5641_19345 [Mycobacterium sp. 1554424.7]